VSEQVLPRLCRNEDLGAQGLGPSTTEFNEVY